MSRKSTPQIPLNLAPEPDYSFKSFVIGDSNADAIKAVQAYPDWPAPVLALIGPKGSGKSHLARAWAAQQLAAVITPSDKAPKIEWKDRPLLLDDAQGTEESLLFAVMNMALNGDIPGLLMTGIEAPRHWMIDLPDLQSRLKNVAIARLTEPDDALLETIVRKLFDDQGREVSRDLVHYLLAYHDRNVDVMAGLVTELDAAASESKADLTKAFAARYLSRQKNTDLFAD